MKRAGTIAVLTMMLSLAGATLASAANINIGDPTAGLDPADQLDSQTWTADNEYILKDTVYVKPGATLTIEPGTIVRGDSNAQRAALVVPNGAKIYANGTKDAPIVFTSTNDTGGADGLSDSWRPVCAEWGNLTVMGDAYVGKSDRAGNTANPTGNNVMQMEGLSAGVDLTLFGGGNDDDNSGALRYVTLRYGGYVQATADELNGLSLGGVGRGTDIDHVEIMNNIDDGIEIWGGAVNLKYVSIWNIGDDSFDLDTGWRGMAQFGLIVQGWCDENAQKQGSGVGDNCCEMDGAENAGAQPFSAPLIYNFTVIGEPNSGDQGTEWRDNMRAQFHKCIFMDIGDKMVKDGGTGGDGGGYGNNGADTWANIWSKNATDGSGNVANMVPALSGYSQAFINALYPNYLTVGGKWAQFSDCVFYNLNETASLSINQGTNNVMAGSRPIAALNRVSTPDFPGGIPMQRVTGIDPRAINDATTSAEYGTGVVNGYIADVPYRGAFSEHNNWLKGWTAADRYGFVIDDPANPIPDDPEADGELTKVVTETSFPTDAGVVYTVEESTDMVDWTPVGTVIGDGTTMSVEDLDDFDAKKFYRVIAQ